MAGDGIRSIIAPSGGGERASDPAFADASRPGDEPILLAADPIAIDELGKEGAVDIVRCAWIFNDCVLPE